MGTNYLETIKSSLIQYINNCDSYWESSVASRKTKAKLENDIKKIDQTIKTVTGLNQLIDLINEYNEVEMSINSAQKNLNNLKTNGAEMPMNSSSSSRKHSLITPLSDSIDYFTKVIQDGAAKKFELRNKINFLYKVIKNYSTIQFNYDSNIIGNIKTCIKVNTYELINATDTLTNTINNTINDTNLEKATNVHIPNSLNIDLSDIAFNIKKNINEIIEEINNINTSILNYVNTLTGKNNNINEIQPYLNPEAKYNFNTNRAANIITNSATKNTNNNNMTYTVQKGDSLSAIAKKYYGDPNKYNIIYEANKSLIGNNPSIISIGQELVIPGITVATNKTQQVKPQPATELVTKQNKDNSVNKTNSISSASGNANSNNNNNNATLQDRTIAGMKEKDAQSMTVPNDINTNFKSYTKYTAVTKKTDNNGNYVMKQSAILYGDRPDSNGVKYNTYTDSDTHVRCVDINNEKYYCVAMGDYYGNVGDTFNITTSEGNNFNVIVCDAKGKDSTAYLDIASQKVIGHKQGSNNMSIIEFYYDGAAGLPDDMKVRGGSTGTFNSVPKFKGNISQVLKTSTYESHVNNNVL